MIRLIVTIYYGVLLVVSLAYLLSIIEQSASFPRRIEFGLVISGLGLLGLIGQVALIRQRKLEAMEKNPRGLFVEPA